MYYKKKLCSITIDSDLLIRYPELTKLKSAIEYDEVASYLKLLNSRDEVSAKITTHGVRVSARSINDREQRKRYDDLGILQGDKKFNDICNAMREDSGHDPRRYMVVTKKSLSYSDDIIKNIKYSGKHALEVITDEELLERRRKLNDRSSKGASTSEDSNRSSKKAISKIPTKSKSRRS